MMACLFFIFLVPLAGAGIALINAGLGRSRNAGHMMMAAISTLSIAAIVYFVCGFAWQGFIGRPGHIFALSGKSWSWIAAEPFFFRGLALDGSPASLAALLQIFCVGLAALIPLGSGADRFGCDPGWLDLSAFCALGLGGRLAGAARRQLRTRSRIYRRRGSELDS